VFVQPDNPAIEHGGGNSGCFHLRHADTAHSCQGKDVLNPAKLFIDPRNLFCAEHVYVLVSRPQAMSQMRLLGYPETKVETRTSVVTEGLVHLSAKRQLTQHFLNKIKDSRDDYAVHGDGGDTVVYDNAVMEYPISGCVLPGETKKSFIVADVMLLCRGIPVFALEVHDTNPVSTRKIQIYLKSNIRVVQVRAELWAEDAPVKVCERIDLAGLAEFERLLHLEFGDLGACVAAKRESLITFIAALRARLGDASTIDQVYERKTNLVGRRYPNGASLTLAAKSLRWFCARKHYHDLDMVNCHPVIIDQYCCNNNINAPIISRYSRHREQVLREIQVQVDNAHYERNFTREEAKAAVLRVCYGGAPEVGSSILAGLAAEMIPIYQSVCLTHPQFHKFAQSRWTNPRKAARVTLAVWAQTIESQILDVMVTSVRKQSGEDSVGSLIYDGMLVTSPNLNLAKIVKQVRQATGYEVTLKYKPWSMFPPSLFSVSGVDIVDPELFSKTQV
jgi:hypothetical protein